MPSNMVKALAQKSGKSVEQVEKAWKEAEKIVQEEGIPESDREQYYGTLVTILKKKLGIEDRVRMTVILNGDSVRSLGVEFI